jgi:DNA-binding Lrp family transcriptional regulator
MGRPEASLRVPWTPPEAGSTRALDEIDRSIVRLLQDDGNLTNVEIARHLNISEATVRRRRVDL